MPNFVDATKITFQYILAVYWGRGLKMYKVGNDFTLGILHSYEQNAYLGADFRDIIEQVHRLPLHVVYAHIGQGLNKQIYLFKCKLLKLSSNRLQNSTQRHLFGRKRGITSFLCAFLYFPMVYWYIQDGHYQSGSHLEIRIFYLFS